LKVRYFFATTKNGAILRPKKVPAALPPEVVKFDEFELDCNRYQLLRAGHRLKLEKLPMELLILLLEKEGHLVTREEIVDRLWGEDVFLDTEHGINTAVRKIRNVLRDDPEAPRFVQTVTGKGYRFVAPINLGGNGVAPVMMDVPVVTSQRRDRFWLVGSSIGVILIAALAGLFMWRSFWQQPRKLTEKDTVVIAEFNNTTGDPAFDGALLQALSADLAQSPFLTVLSDEQVQQTLQLMGQTPVAKLTADLAREVCQRTSSAAFLEGSVSQIGTQYLLVLKSVNCSTNELMTNSEVQANDKNHVLEALRNLAVETRNNLGGSLTSVQKSDVPMEPVTTSSLEALKTFSVYAHGGGLVPAFPSLLHVIELDPNFTEAYAQLADAYSDAGEAELAAEYAQKAFERRGNVSERERLSISSTYYFYTLGDLEQELRTERVAQQMYPRSWGPWNDASGTWRLLGEHDRALKESQEALRLNGNAVNPYLNVGSSLLCLERTEEARQIGLRALEHGIDAPGTHLLMYRAAFLKSDSNEMRKQIAPLLGETGKGIVMDALLAQSSTEAYFGRLSSARTLSMRAFEKARKSKFYEMAAQVRVVDALREAEFGELAEARNDAGGALSLSSGRIVKLFSALALARAGDVGQAEALATELETKFGSNTLIQKYWLPTIRASIALARNKPAQALDFLNAGSYEFSDTQSFVGNMYPVYVRGQAYLTMHQGRAAAAEFHKFVEHRGIVLNSPLGALARLGLARSYLLQGDTVRAGAAYLDFLELWRDADIGVPVLKQAKAEYAKLNKTGSPKTRCVNCS
jgi:eukaryotic-like serine/threonine-protein kinase